MKIFASFAFLLILLSATAFAAEKETFQFPNGRQVGQIDKVSCELKIGGEVLHSADGKDHREKISEIHRLIYDEKTLAVSSDLQGESRSARYYEQVESAIKLGTEGEKFPLREDRKLIGVEITGQSATLFSPRGPLTQDELISIDILGNSLLLDRFLPEKPVAVGDSWKQSDKLIGQLLWLDDVGQCDVQSTLIEANDKLARFTLVGKVSGVFKGAVSEIDLEAKYRYDRQLKRIDWIGMRVVEKRKSTLRTDGADVVAVAQVLVKPEKSCEALSDSALKDITFRATPELLQTTFQDKDGHWEIAFDRCWNSYPWQDRMELHFLDRNDIIAQCNITTLPKTDPSKLISREAYQEELRAALDKNFGEFIEASESATSAKYRLFRVVIGGKVSDLPMRWIYYHLADPQGRQAAFVFVVEEKLYDRLAGADKKLVDSFRFLEPKEK